MFFIKEKDFGYKFNRYKQSATVNVSNDYGRRILLDIHFKKCIGTIQVTSDKHKQLEDISMEIEFNRLKYKISIKLLYLTSVFCLLGLLTNYFIFFTFMAGVCFIISFATNKSVNKHMIYYVPDKYGYNPKNYLEYSLIIKREDLIKKK